jgi:hypothetical protein
MAKNGAKFSRDQTRFHAIYKFYFRSISLENSCARRTILTQKR